MMGNWDDLFDWGAKRNLYVSPVIAKRVLCGVTQCVWLQATCREPDR